MSSLYLHGYKMNRLIILCLFVTLSISVGEIRSHVVEKNNSDSKDEGFGRPLVPNVVASSDSNVIVASETKSVTKNSNPVVFCYWASWSVFRSGDGAFGVQDIPTNLCTHVAYSFFDLTANGDLAIPAFYNVNGKSNHIDDFMRLKQQNSNLKLLVAVGGWSAGSTNFSPVAHNEALRRNFVNNIVWYIQDKGLDGLDVDWEYPAQNGGTPSDKQAFVWLLRDLKNAFAPRNWLLTISVGVSQYHIDVSYDVPEISRIVDYINLMTYDYNGVWSQGTGPNAPLYLNGNDVETTVQNWIRSGADRSRLVLGLASYGRSFNLNDPNQNWVGAPFTGPGEAGPYTGEAGFMSYFEICQHQRNYPWEWYINQVASNYVYAVRNRLWVGYDNPNTIFEKAIYSKRQGLAGVMHWAVDMDDPRGQCGETYGLIRSSINGYNYG